MILGGECNTGANPVARWSMGNVVLDTDSAGNIKINKDKAMEKVDPIVAQAMAIAGWLIEQSKPVVTSYLFDEEVKSAWV